VLFASYHCHHDPSSGAAVCTRDLFELLRARGWACGAFTGPQLDTRLPGPVAARLAADPAAQAARGQTGMVSFTVYSSAAGGYPVSTFCPDPPDATRPPTAAEAGAFVRVFADAVRQFRPDVVLTYGGDAASLGAAEAARRAGAGVAFWLHNFAYTSAAPLRRCDAVIVPSEASRAHYRAALGVDGVVLPGPWNWERIVAPDPDPRFVTFVNPVPEKGVFWFARIAEILGRTRPDIPLLVVEGRGGVDWLGRCGVDLAGVRSVHRMRNTPDPRDFYRAARLLLVPSLCPESFGRVAAEAMMNGVPVLASDRGALPEAVGGGGSLLPIPARHTPATRTPPAAAEVAPWVERIVQLWDDPAAYAAAAGAARSAARAWHPDALLPRWERFLEELAGARSAASL
jgi:glycosyltransferase involved in cell wall biosynthesis